MAVLINYKICDNAEECGGIAVCPTGALSWDKTNETIKIENEKCISCGLCEKECPIGAFYVTKDDHEYQLKKKEIDDDPRTTKDLFVDRYGAAPLNEFFMISQDEINSKIKDNNITMIEVYNDDSIQCLLKSIPIKELTNSLPKDMLYYKVSVDDKFIKDYNIQDLPSLLIYNNGRLVKHIDGYYENKDKEQLKELINNSL